MAWAGTPHPKGAMVGMATAQEQEALEQARRIVTAQRSEISEMQATRRRLGLPPAEPPAIPDHRPRSG